MNSKLVFKFGIILSAITILYFLVTNLLGVSGTESAGWIGYLPYLIIIIYAFKTIDLKSYLRRFTFGAKISLIAAIASSLFMYLYLTYIDDLMVRTVVENQIAMVDKNDPTYNDKVIRLQEGITPLFYLKFGIIAGVLIGTIISAVTALFIKVKSK